MVLRPFCMLTWEQNRKFYSIFFKKSQGLRGQSPSSRSAERETPPPFKTQERVNLIAEQSKRGNPNEGFPLKTERHE